MVQSFYERVMIIYLNPVHLHMLPDRVIAWVNQLLKNKNIFIPNDIVKEMNSVKSVKANFIRHDDKRRPCFTGWSTFLNKHYQAFPQGFTSNYVFEFHEGKCTYTHLITDKPEDSTTINIYRRPNHKVTKK